MVFFNPMNLFRGYTDRNHDGIDDRCERFGHRNRHWGDRFGRFGGIFRNPFHGGHGYNGGFPGGHRGFFGPHGGYRHPGMPGRPIGGPVRPVGPRPMVVSNQVSSTSIFKRA